MTRHTPSKPPPGRLVRLGVVVDEGQPEPRTPELARLCDRAGIDTVWLAGGDVVGSDQDDPGRDKWSLWATILRTFRHAGLGFITGANPEPETALAAVGELSRAHPDRVDITVATGPEMKSQLERWREALGGAEGAYRPRLSAALDRLEHLADLLPLVDDVVLSGWEYPDLEAAVDEVRAECAETGRDPASLGVAALIPVSIGRTDAEAAARMQMDPSFARFGHPAETGIFGTLEGCQDRVIALAHSGVTDLRCVLPATPDVHDVIAQLTAMAVGTTEVLRPGSLRSPAPPPPDGWGGRPDQPPAQRVSDGSRRR
jgi:alkanesulfonate monooxygenase SsuD/methylene tetrahydromethanopterin reductase-like flavin-dependent oxidoreductase (luciferase family)